MDASEAAFELYLERVSPAHSQRDAAKRNHTALRTFLEGDGRFGSMVVDTFLNGSYARGTTIRPIRDVDIIVELTAEQFEREPNKLMDALRRKLAQRYDGRRTGRGRRAVWVDLSTVQLDVVLASGRAADGSLHIVDRHEGRWIKTHPRRQLALIQNLQRATNGNYTKLVRTLKAWARVKIGVNDRPSSFVLECAVFNVVRNDVNAFQGSMAQVVPVLFERLRQWEFGRGDDWIFRRPLVPDPALPGDNVAGRWDAAGVQRMCDKLGVALGQCSQAQRSRWEDSEVAKWGTILGAEFPAFSTVVKHFG